MVSSSLIFTQLCPSILDNLITIFKGFDFSFPPDDKVRKSFVIFVPIPNEAFRVHNTDKMAAKMKKRLTNG